MKIAHFGCGPCIIRSPHAEWVNIDISPEHGPDVVMDYLEMVEKFGENHFSHGFSCHSIEHLSWPEGVVRFFQEARKVIEPGGVLRIVVPDLGLVARKYVNGESLQDIYDGPYFTYKDLPATRFLWWARGWEHTVLFDEQLLRELASDTGWTGFQVMPFGKSSVPELCGKDRFETESSCCELTV